MTILPTIKFFFLGGDGRERMSLFPSSEKQRKLEGRFDDHPFLNKKYKVVDSYKFFKSKSSSVHYLSKTLIIESRLFRTFKRKLMSSKLSRTDALKVSALPCVRRQLVSISSSYLVYSRQVQDSRGRSQGFTNESFK